MAIKIIVEEDLINDYLSGFNDAELAEKHDASERTIRYKLQSLREEEKIPYRNDLNEKIKYENENTVSLSKIELQKLLALYGSKTSVSKKIGLSVQAINRFCEEYGIVDNKTLSTKLNSALKSLIKNYNPIPQNKHVISGSETLVLGTADWHVGKHVKDSNGNTIYDLDVFKKRADGLVKSIFKLLDKHLSKHVRIDKAVILSAGDMANGEGIYPTQVYEQSEAPPKQVMIVVEYFMKIILSFLQRNIPVEFYGVKGNHGRLGKDADPASNWDLMSYMILQQNKQLMNLKNLSVFYSESDYMEVPIRKWKYLLRHEAFPQDETSAGQAKYLGWQMLHKTDLIVSGHTHHWDVNSRRVVIPSVVGGDDLSERLAKTEGEPSQLLWLSTDERSHTNIYPVDLKSKQSI